MASAAGAWLTLSPRGLSSDLFFRPRLLLADLGLGLGCGGALLGLWWLARRAFALGARLEDHFVALLRGIEPREAVALAALSSFAEELLFRGAVQGAWGLVPATVLFAVLHTGPSPALRLWTLFAAVAGLAFGLLAAWREVLLPPMVAHFTVNAVNLYRLARAPRDAVTLGSSSPPTHE